MASNYPGYIPDTTGQPYGANNQYPSQPPVQPPVQPSQPYYQPPAQPMAQYNAPVSYASLPVILPAPINIIFNYHPQYQQPYPQPYQQPQYQQPQYQQPQYQQPPQYPPQPPHPPPPPYQQSQLAAQPQYQQVSYQHLQYQQYNAPAPYAPLAVNPPAPPPVYLQIQPQYQQPYQQLQYQQPQYQQPPYQPQLQPQLQPQPAPQPHPQLIPQPLPPPPQQIQYQHPPQSHVQSHVHSQNPSTVLAPSASVIEESAAIPASRLERLVKQWLDEMNEELGRYALGQTDIEPDLYNSYAVDQLSRFPALLDIHEALRIRLEDVRRRMAPPQSTTPASSVHQHSQTAHHGIQESDHEPLDHPVNRQSPVQEDTRQSHQMTIHGPGQPVDREISIHQDARSPPKVASPPEDQTPSLVTGLDTLSLSPATGPSIISGSQTRSCDRTIVALPRPASPAQSYSAIPTQPPKPHWIDRPRMQIFLNRKARDEDGTANYQWRRKKEELYDEHGERISEDEESSPESEEAISELEEPFYDYDEPFGEWPSPSHGSDSDLENNHHTDNGVDISQERHARTQSTNQTMPVTERSRQPDHQQTSTRVGQGHRRLNQRRTGRGGRRRTYDIRPRPQQSQRPHPQAGTRR